MPQYTKSNVEVHHRPSLFAQLMIVASFFIAILIREATPMRKITRTKTPRTMGRVDMTAV